MYDELHALDQLREADRRIWEVGQPGCLEARDSAARVALQAGATVEQMARHVGVRPHDIAQWIRSRP